MEKGGFELFNFIGFGTQHYTGLNSIFYTFQFGHYIEGTVDRTAILQL